jgi:hypothetical protein
MTFCDAFAAAAGLGVGAASAVDTPASESAAVSAAVRMVIVRRA